jgi:uncharacterized protein
MSARLVWLLAALLALLVAAPVSAAEIPPSPTRRVTDDAGVLSPATRDDLEARLQAYERESGHQVLVWIGRTSGDATIEDFAVRAFEAWKIGRAGLDDGLALFVLVEDRKVRIEVGYGLEDRVTDLEAARIIRDTIVPAIGAGDFDLAIRSGVESIADTIEGRPDALPAGSGSIRGPPPEAPARGWLSNIWVLLLGLAFLVLLVTHPRLALLLLWSLAARRGGGGFGGGGGMGGFSGFSGGGGRSGGGGATGGW